MAYQVVYAKDIKCQSSNYAPGQALFYFQKLKILFFSPDKLIIIP